MLQIKSPLSGDDGWLSSCTYPGEKKRPGCVLLNGLTVQDFPRHLSGSRCQNTCQPWSLHITDRDKTKPRTINNNKTKTKTKTKTKNTFPLFERKRIGKSAVICQTHALCSNNSFKMFLSIIQIKVKKVLAGQWWLMPLIPALGISYMRKISEIKARLVYRASSRIARVTQKNSILGVGGGRSILGNR